MHPALSPGKENPSCRRGCVFRPACLHFHCGQAHRPFSLRGLCPPALAYSLVSQHAPKPAPPPVPALSKRVCEPCPFPSSPESAMSSIDSLSLLFCLLLSILFPQTGSKDPGEPDTATPFPAWVGADTTSPFFLSREMACPPPPPPSYPGNNWWWGLPVSSLLSQ